MGNKTSSFGSGHIEHILDIDTQRRGTKRRLKNSLENIEGSCAKTMRADEWVENKEYIINSRKNTNILIVYSTNRRAGAVEEAQTIYDACKHTFQEKNITLKKDYREEEIIEMINRAAQQSSPKAFIVILASHGNVGTIDDCYGKPIKLSEIEKAMCSDILEGRPKMLITQCCQIGEPSIRTPAYAPTHDDFCAVMSCVSGQASERGVFLSKLSEQIKQNQETGDQNIFKLISRVSTDMEREGHKQTPIIMSTFRADFCPNDC